MKTEISLWHQDVAFSALNPPLITGKHSDCIIADIHINAIIMSSRINTKQDTYSNMKNWNLQRSKFYLNWSFTSKTYYCIMWGKVIWGWGKRSVIALLPQQDTLIHRISAWIKYSVLVWELQESRGSTPSSSASDSGGGGDKSLDMGARLRLATLELIRERTGLSLRGDSSGNTLCELLLHSRRISWTHIEGTY